MKPKNIFWLAFAGAILMAVWPGVAPRERTPFRVDDFAALPVLEGGRIKPLDSVARNSLLMIRGTQSFPSSGRTISATEWLMDALMKPEAADAHPVFTIDDPDLLGLLGLDGSKARRFAFWQIDSKGLDEIRAQNEKAQAVDAAKRTRFQNAVVNFAARVELYQQLENTIALPRGGDPAADLDAFARAAGPAMQAMHHGQGKKLSASDQKAVSFFMGMIDRYRFLMQAAAFRPIPPAAGQPDEQWLSFGEAAMSTAGGAARRDLLVSYARLAQAYRRIDQKAFSDELDGLLAALERERPAAAAQARRELVYNRMQPFISGMALYVAALLAIFAWWGTGKGWARSAALGLFSAAFLVHSAGLIARVLLQGRPPVTNLYSSAVFVGWVAAGVGLLAERTHRKGFAAAGGALLGFCTLLIAHHLTASGDTMEMMRAVLDSNFWLATHVVTVTIGYAGTFLAGALGIAWALRRQFVAEPDPETSRALVSLAYGVVAFSLFFSFVGTVLGGIWADQSWGRFWGWDPKENGALLIVLWNALILHARWSGIARERGIMAMIIFGNVVTSLSWFGVNMLGIGLHSYGFMDQAFWWLLAFGASQFVLIALAMLPERMLLVNDGRDVPPRRKSA